MAVRETDVLRTRIAQYWRDDDGVVNQVYDKGCVVSGEDALDALKMFQELGGGAPIRLLADIRGLKSASRESREAGDTPEYVAAMGRVAVVVGSPASRVIGNFFMRFSKPSYPTRLFTDEEAARQWLSATR